MELAEKLGQYFSLTPDDTKALRIAAMLHDVGMSAAGNAAQTGVTPLSTVEWGMLKMHPVIAAEILTQTPALGSVIPLVYHHHEHYDGSGYVAGLSGSDIPLGARILAVADAYVAMTSTRPYRQTLTQTQAIDELQRLAGSQFDPRVVHALVTIVGDPDRQGLLLN
jgi:HD-GYP domain-containing protein (c-di-GMP phosphodiesterase class II)